MVIPTQAVARMSAMVVMCHLDVGTTTWEVVKNVWISIYVMIVMYAESNGYRKLSGTVPGIKIAIGRIASCYSRMQFHYSLPQGVSFVRDYID